MQKKTNKTVNVHIRRTFFKQNFLFSLSLMLAPLIFLNVLMLSYTQTKLKNEFEQNAIRSLTYAQKQLEQVFEEVLYFRTVFASNPTMSLRLLSTLSGTSMSYADAVSLRDMYISLSNLSTIKSAVKSIYLSQANCNYMVVDSTRVARNTYVDKEWYEIFENQEKNISSWLALRNIKNYEFEEATQVLSVFHRLNYDCVMVVNLDLDYITALLASGYLYQGQKIGVLSDNNTILFSNDMSVEDLNILNTAPENIINNNPLRQKGHYVVQLPMERYNLNYVSLIPVDAVYAIPNLLVQLTIIISVIAVVVSGLLSYFHTRKDYLQISQIIDTFVLAEQNEPLPEIVHNNNDAYSFILQNTIQTFIKQSYLNVQLSQRKYALFSAQLAALQYQINPHFMFNTLQSISMEVQKITGAQSVATQMIGQLSDILRYALGDPHQKIPLSDEIEITKSYVNILKYRHRQNVQVYWDYKPEYLEYKITRMLLQPLIENAITHAAKDNGIVRVKVRFHLKDEVLCVKIIDNGKGMSKEKINELHCSFNTAQDLDTVVMHIGLKNIDARLRLMHPDKKGLLVQSKLGFGTVIRFYITVKK